MSKRKIKDEEEQEDDEELTQELVADDESTYGDVSTAVFDSDDSNYESSDGSDSDIKKEFDSDDDEDTEDEKKKPTTTVKNNKEKVIKKQRISNDDDEDTDDEKSKPKKKTTPASKTTTTTTTTNTGTAGPSKKKDGTIKQNSGNNSKTTRDEKGLIELPLMASTNSNQLITDILSEVAIFEKNKGATHKYNAYRKAIQSIRVYPKKLTSGSESKKLDGVGAKIAKKVQEILDTGKLNKLVKLQADPKLVAVNNISRVSGIGPAIAKKLVEDGVMDIESLKKVKTLNHHQQVGLKYFDDIEQRVPRAEIEKIEAICKDHLKKIDKYAMSEICGSYRRGAATSGDIDILLTHPKFDKEKQKEMTNKKNKDISFNLIEKLIKVLKESGVIVDDISMGPYKYMGCCILPKEMSKNGSKPIVRRIDFKLVPIESYYFGLLHNTGSDEFNRQMRVIALSKGYTLSEYSINKVKGPDKGEDIMVNSEKEIFDIIGMKYYPPTQRSL